MPLAGGQRWPAIRIFGGQKYFSFRRGKKRDISVGVFGQRTCSRACLQQRGERLVWPIRLRSRELVLLFGRFLSALVSALQYIFGGNVEVVSSPCS